MCIFVIIFKNSKYSVHVSLVSARTAVKTEVIRTHVDSSDNFVITTYYIILEQHNSHSCNLPIIQGGLSQQAKGYYRCAERVLKVIQDKKIPYLVEELYPSHIHRITCYIQSVGVSIDNNACHQMEITIFVTLVTVKVYIC